MKKILLFLLTISLLSLPMSACTEDKNADSQTVEASEEKNVVLNLTAEANNILEKYNPVPQRIQVVLEREARAEAKANAKAEN